MRPLVFALVATTTVLFASALAKEFNPPEKVIGIATASDSDTVHVRGVPFLIRLHGIDGPEAGQTCNAKDGGKWPCGLVAAQELRHLIDGRMIECHRAGQGKDQYGRMLAICQVDGLNINEHMIKRGLAWSFRKYSDDYNALEEEAKAHKEGIWQVQCTQPPWDYRRNAWEDALREAPEGKPIKGNFARTGGCIYHTPWSPYWRKVNMQKPGNQWFGTEAEAIKAGCRPPYRITQNVRSMTPEAVAAALPCNSLAEKSATK
jgi:endonuclease YncB( thermonuclease family)